MEKADGDVGMVSAGRVSANSRQAAQVVSGLLPSFRIKGVLFPLSVTEDTEVVFVIYERFLETGAGDIGEFDFGFR